MLWIPFLFQSYVEIAYQSQWGFRPDTSSAKTLQNMPNVVYPLVSEQFLHWSVCKAQAHVLLLSPVHVMLILML